MPEIGRIQSTNFQALLTRLGISRNEVPFSLRSEVSPVVVVGGEISIVASPSPAYGVTDVFTTGLQTNPAATTVLADTGPLPVGPYTVKVWMFVESSVLIFIWEWRDAANGANLFTTRFIAGLTGENILEVRFDIENPNERFRISNEAAPGAGIDVQAVIMAKI